MFNLHTHTYRCHHAKGTDEEYVIKAIENGYDLIGFSDHAPYLFPNGYVSSFRMLPSDAQNYADSIKELREKYKGKIDIKLGFELEYYPRLIDREIEFLKSLDYDYLILGQHYVDNEYEDYAIYSDSPTKSLAVLDKYISQVILGAKSGLFTYIAHPDLINFKGDNKLYIQKMTYMANELKKLDIPLRRFKTGTPSRVNRKSIDFSNLEEQDGDEETVPFSFETQIPPKNKVCCHITYSNEKTKQIILENLDRSPMYSGKIEGKGPRYCPSFEDKIVRFKDKERHQLFIEPCGLETEEMYLQGLSSSLPEDVQLAFIHTIPGLEHAQVMRTAYAIENDCVDPTALNATLEFNSIKGLYGAGQFNGSSGYEEAAAQGLVAGINAALKIKGEEPMILDRGGSYIGTLIDDLVTKGCTDPYRMMTSRSEYRLVLRQDNADVRLTPIGYKIGLISQERYDKFISKEEMVKAERERIEQKSIPLTDALQKIMEDCGTTPLERGCKMIELLKRPQITYKALTSVDDDRPDLPRAVFEQVEIAVKYEGYIKRQEQQIKEMRRIECKKIPADIDYYSLKGLRLEAVEKLSKIKPENLGQASRISGVNPADIAALNIILETL